MTTQSLSWPCIAFLLAWMCRPAIGREVPDSDFDVLLERSDVVVVATPIARKQVDVDVATLEPWSSQMTDRNEKMLRHIYRFNEFLIAEVTTFKVNASLKGDVSEKEIKVFHFTWKSAPAELEGGPAFFMEGFLADDVAPANLPRKRSGGGYMLFLNRRSDAQYDPATGQLDSVYSVKHLDQLLTQPPLKSIGIVTP